MPDTTFQPGTVITSDWLNDVNDHVYNGQNFDGVGYINVMDPTYGALGDGSDDTTAINLAEAAAYAANTWLYFPPGKTFGYTGTFTCRVSVIGFGSELVQLSGTEALTGFLYYNGTNNVSVIGIKINGNSTRRPLLFNNCDNISVAHVIIEDALFGGIAFYDSSYITLHNSTVDGVVLDAVQTVAADGVYFGSCSKALVTNCTAKNFERIGFVTEGDVSTKSDQIYFVNCIADTASNCDVTVGEFNAGFWHENTNNISYVNCAAINIASGVAQTSKRVRGFVSAVGSSARCKVNYVACVVAGNTVDINIGFSAQGTSQYPSVNYDGCSVTGCENGLYTVGGIDVLSIENFDVDDITAGSGQGAITLDISGSAVNEIHIDGLRVTNKTYHADAADINWFSANSSTIYTLKSTYGVSHIMRQAVASATVSNATVEFGSGNYAGFSAATLVFGPGTTLSPRSGAIDKRLFQDFQMSGGIVKFNGATISGGGSFEMTFSGASVNIVADASIFDGLTVNMNMTGTYTHQFTGCRITSVPATNGFYRSNSATATRQVLIMSGCYFEASNDANTPLIKNTNNPTNTVLQSNTYTMTTLYTFDGGVTQANNTAV